MNKFTEKAKERLQTRLNSLQDKLGTSLTNDSDDIDEIVIKIREAEVALKNSELIGKVQSINNREIKKRTVLKKIISIGLFSSDLLTNDNKLNKSKRKQNPELYKFYDEQKFMYFSIGYDQIISIHINGHKFYTGKKIYSSGETSEILPFESFEDACSFNNVQVKNITVKQVQKQIDRIKKATEILKAAGDKYGETKKANNSYFLESEGFFDQQNANIHTLYTTF